MQLKVLTWNIWRGKYFDQVIKELKEIDADIIGLQELIQIKDDIQAQKIADALGMHYVYFQAFTSDRHEIVYSIGDGIFSKYPLKDPQCHFLTDLSVYKDSSDSEPRIAVSAQVEINDQTLNIISTHLAYSHELKESEIRDLQVEKLLGLVEAKTILMGDFNAKTDSKTIQSLDQVLSRVETTDAPTWSVFPVDYRGYKVSGLECRIDQIYADPKLKIVESKVLSSQASDHLPILSVFEI